MTQPNPIELELAKLAQQWEEFIDAEQPILMWEIPSDAHSVAHAFVKVKEQFTDDSSDFFISLSSEFENPETFAFTLAVELNAAIAHGLNDAMSDETIDNDSANTLKWTAPKIDRRKNSFIALMESCDHAIKAFGNFFDCFTLVIMPTSIADISSYTQWIDACCALHGRTSLWPEKLKLVFLDDAGTPWSHQLVQTRSKEICIKKAPLDLNAAIKEILRKANNGTPEAYFRELLVDLNQAVGEGDSAKMDKVAERALNIAQHYSWTDMIATIYLIRAAGYLNLKMHDQALKDYQLAQGAATQGVTEQKPGCDKLQLQACLCEGTTLFSAKKLEEAARAYGKAAEFAELYKDKFMGLEGRRMQSFCYEKLDNIELAWQAGEQALIIGNSMEAAERKNTTLNFVGEAMLRIAPNKHQQTLVHQAMEKLLGGEWQNTPATAAQKSEAAAC